MASVDTPSLSLEEALSAINALRSNVVGSQSAGWSNLMYPLVAILNAAGLEQFDPSEEQLRHHMDCYGGAGGYPGHELREPMPGWCEPVGRLARLTETVKRFLANPTDEHREQLKRVVA